MPETLTQIDRLWLSLVPEETTVVCPAGLDLETWITGYVESGRALRDWLARVEWRWQELAAFGESGELP